jgi:uncharacterized protein YegP (UPF0339 family)
MKRKKKVTFEVLRAADDVQYFGHIVTKNGRITFTAETMTRKHNVIKSWNSLVEAIKSGEYEIHDLTKFTK